MELRDDLEISADRDALASGGMLMRQMLADGAAQAPRRDVAGAPRSSPIAKFLHGCRLFVKALRERKLRVTRLRSRERLS